MIALSVEMFVCLSVCGHKNEHFERSKPVYELYLKRMSRKCEILASMYLTIESDLRRAQKS